MRKYQIISYESNSCHVHSSLSICEEGRGVAGVCACVCVEGECLSEVEEASPKGMSQGLLYSRSASLGERTRHGYR